MSGSLPVLSGEQAREIDSRALREHGLTGLVLMENAGRGCADVLQRLGIDGPVRICAGKGNNGGDGYVIARHLDNAGFIVRVGSAVDPSVLIGDAAVNHMAWVSGNGAVDVVEAGGCPTYQYRFLLSWLCRKSISLKKVNKRTEY